MSSQSARVVRAGLGRERAATRSHGCRRRECIESDPGDPRRVKEAPTAWLRANEPVPLPHRPPRRSAPAPSANSVAAAAAIEARVARSPAPQRGEAKATINDVARLAGVSKKTVSRIINHSPLVRAETREKVTALMTELGYRPDPLARGLAFRRSFLIGMVYDNPNAQYIVNMQYGALEGLRGSGFELVVHPCDSKSEDYIEDVRHFVLQQRLHGVILVPRVSEDQALVDMLKEVGCRYARIAAVLAGRGRAHDRDQRSPGRDRGGQATSIARPSAPAASSPGPSATARRASAAPDSSTPWRDAG